MPYKHGVYVSEQETSLTAPISGTAGLQVIFGTAPVNLVDNPAGAVNTPKLCYSYKEACAAVGYSDDWEKYTLCQSIYTCFNVQNVAPIILVNVLDPAVHKTAAQPEDAPVNDKQAVFETLGILKNSVVIKLTSAAESPLVLDEDYTLSFNSDGKLVATIIAGGGAESATSLYLSSANVIDPTMVDFEDIIGTASGNVETGLQTIRQIYPMFGMTPGLLVAPGWSHYPSVAAAMQAKCTEINGCFSCECVLDICTVSGINEGSTAVPYAATYADVLTAKNSLGATSSHAIACWPMAKVGSKKFYMSAIMAALTQQLDAQNDDVPYLSPSNKSCGATATVLYDETEIKLDQDQANTVNGYGVVTMLNLNGFKSWGNNSCAYPSTTDPKDRWFCCRRFFTWAGNSFILTYFQKVDNPMNKRLVENIVDSANIAGNGYVARGYCATYRVEYLAEENPTTDILNGKITFHQYLAPYTPAEDIEDILEFDTEALTAALQQ